MKNKNLENNIYGVSIITGTTGSGKSTTLQTIISNKLKEINGNIKVGTFEEPPEYFITGATQVPVIRKDCDKIK